MAGQVNTLFFNIVNTYINNIENIYKQKYTDRYLNKTSYAPMRGKIRTRTRDLNHAMQI
jgi:hypothetical protein